MWQPSMLISCNIIISIILDFTQAINTPNNEIIHAKTDEYIVFTSDLFEKFVVYTITNTSITSINDDGFKDKNFDSIYHGEYTVRTVTNYSISKPSSDKIFQNANSIKFVYNDWKWNLKTITLTGEYCDLNGGFSDTANNYTECFNALEYYQPDYNYNLNEILRIEWTPEYDMKALEITYFITKNVNNEIGVKIFQEKYGVRTVIQDQLFLDMQPNLKKLTIQHLSSIEGIKYDIQFTSKGYLRFSAYYARIFAILKVEHSYSNINLRKKTECGPNLYGNDCSKMCSLHEEKCKRMYFCTSIKTCACSAGLTGPLCDIDCPFHKYGADCRHYCSSNCLNQECNRYTGACTLGCQPGYTLPNCTEKYTKYLLKPPTLVSNECEMIKIEINFDAMNIKGNNTSNIKYFQLQYKATYENKLNRSEIMFFDINNINVTHTINNLIPGTTYYIGVLLIMNDGVFNEEDVVFGQYKTNCLQPSVSDYNVNVIEGIRNISITWETIMPSRLECNITKYLLTLMFSNVQNTLTERYNISSSSDNNYVIKDLIPGYQYGITITAFTSVGPLATSSIHKATPKYADDDVSIEDISATVTEKSEKINISWKIVLKDVPNARIDPPVSCIVKYKVNRLFSCSLTEIDNPWTSVTVYDKINYDILNFIPNTQYSIQVLPKDFNETTQNTNTVYVLTPTSKPSIEPTLDLDHPIYITNNSILIHWKIDPNRCKDMNGMFFKFAIELKDMNDNTSTIRETKQNHISLNNLKSNTNYEVRIFVHNTDEYNPERYLFVDFKTKSENLMQVDDLMVYKKSLKNRMVGLRWSYPENTNVDTFIVSFDRNDNVIQPAKCSAWPNFYCHTFNNLHLGNNYTIKVKAKSFDYPEGGKASSVTYTTIDGIPDSPDNLKAIDIGDTNITLQWDIPWIFNGVLKSFILNAEEISSQDVQTCCVGITPVEIPLIEESPTYNFTLTDLKPGSTYSIGVLSKSFWYGSPSRIQVTTLLKNN